MRITSLENPNPVYYLKYRPQSLKDLTGQDTVKETLSAAFKNNKLAHAYLFVGPRGTGKTSTARILAKMVNCEKRLSDNSNAYDYPCNKCSACLSITDGSNLDLIEIDAASNRGIEDIRSLRETIKLSPSGKGKKVYIIDEVHMLTPEAFNALLKTLEEPPSHALFILATTDVSKLPATILSRVQRLDFSLATREELKEILSRIIKSEGVDIEDDALEEVVKKADGSFRDGVKLLDQLSATGEKITSEFFVSHFKTGKFEDLLDLLEDLALSKATQSLIKVSGLIKAGIEAKELILSLSHLIRDLVLIKSGVGEQLVKSKYSGEKYIALVSLAGKIKRESLINYLNVLQKALEKLKFISIASLPLELAVIEICAEVEVSEDQQVPQASHGESSKDPSNDISKSHEVSQTGKVTKEIKIKDENNIPEKASDDILKLKEKWNFVLETIRPYNFSLEALLRSVNVAECGKETIIIEVPYSFHQRILEAPKNRDILESILSDILGRPIRVSTVLGNRPVKREDIANIEVAADDEIIKAAAAIFNSEPIN